jgi:hypothetical protein
MKKQNQNQLNSYTSIPTTLQGRKEKAERYILELEELTPFRCGDRNGHLEWLRKQEIDRKFFFSFVDWWFNLSRFQPMTLLKIMSALDHEEQKAIIENFIEEAGLRKKGHQPHWWHLERLIEKLGGKITPNRESEAMLKEFLHLLDSATRAQAIGYMASIEFPGLLISEYFTTLVTKIGRTDLIESDFYVNVHTKVEFEHVIKSAGSMLLWINDKERQEKYEYSPIEVIEAFQRGMQFWTTFWERGFSVLGYANPRLHSKRGWKPNLPYASMISTFGVMRDLGIRAGK